MAQPRRVNLDEQAKELSCTTIIIADQAVTAAKLAAGAVTGASIADGSITTVKLDIDANLDFNNFQALDFRIENLSADPTAGNPGRLIWRTDLLQIRVDNGSAFVPITGGGSGANTALSNLASTAINVSLLPATNDTINLGDISHVWDTLFARQITSDTSVLTLTNNVSISGNVAVSQNFALFLNGLGDPNWEFGVNLNLFTKSLITGNSLDVVTGVASGDGFAIGGNGGSSYFEIAAGGNGYFRQNLSFGGGISVSSFTLRTSTASGYILTSDGSGNGSWAPAPSSAGTFSKDFVTVASPVSDHVITLSHTPIVNSEIVTWQGIILTPHSGIDYTILGNVVTLSGSITLTVGDELQVSYSY